MNSYDRLKGIQLVKIRKLSESTRDFAHGHNTINNIMVDEGISQTSKHNCIINAVLDDSLELSSVEEFLRGYPDKKSTDYRRLLCVFDFKKYFIIDED